MFWQKKDSRHKKQKSEQQSELDPKIRKYFLIQNMGRGYG